MNKIKQFYSIPTAELLVVRFEGGFLTGSPDGSWDNSIKNGSVWNQNEEDYGLE